MKWQDVKKSAPDKRETAKEKRYNQNVTRTTQSSKTFTSMTQVKKLKEKETIVQATIKRTPKGIRKNAITVRGPRRER